MPELFVVLTVLLALDVMCCLAHDGDDDFLVCLMCWLCDPALHAVAHASTLAKLCFLGDCVQVHQLASREGRVSGCPNNAVRSALSGHLYR